MEHYEESLVIPAKVEEIFAFMDDPNHLSSHMNKSSWIMGGGKMETWVDEGKGQKVGSHIKMSGKVFGINLFLDEVVTHHEPPFHKEWQTVGKINLLVIDHYTLGFEIESTGKGSQLRVYIKYDLPKSAKTYLLGLLFGKMYAKWCVKQMLQSSRHHFTS